MRVQLYILYLLFAFQAQAQQSDFKEIDFSQADKNAQHHKGEALLNLPLLTHNLTAQLQTDAERFRAIYYWVCHNIKGNYFLISKNNYKLKKLQNDSLALHNWKRTFRKEVFTRLVEKKETLCTGYAYLIKEMANRAGITCEIVYGRSITGKATKGSSPDVNHSWNAVKLNGTWYLCDATWSAGYTDMSTQLFEFDYDNSYFLMKPETFLKSHIPLDRKWSLLETNN